MDWRAETVDPVADRWDLFCDGVIEDYDLPWSDVAYLVQAQDPDTVEITTVDESGYEGRRQV